MAVTYGKSASTTVFTTSADGLVPAGSGGSLTTQFLRKDSTWAVPAGGGGGLSDGDYGDITVGGTGTTMDIDAGAVTLAKMADLANNRIIGNNTGGAAAPVALTVSNVKTMLDLAGTNSGDQTSIVGITGTLAEFNAALTGADFATGGGTATGTNTGDQTTAAADITDSGAFGRSMLQTVTAAGGTALLNLATASVKGLAPVLSNVATEYLNGTGNWSTPAGGAGGPSPILSWAI